MAVLRRGKVSGWAEVQREVPGPHLLRVGVDSHYALAFQTGSEVYVELPRHAPLQVGDLLRMEVTLRVREDPLPSPRGQVVRVELDLMEETEEREGIA